MDASLEYDQESCDALRKDNIEMSDGSLKLKVKKEETKYLGHDYTGITIATKMCFRKSRIEIKAKLPKGFLLSSAAFMSSFEYMCQQGHRNGQVDIAKLYNTRDIITFQSTLHYGRGGLSDITKHMEINSNEWIIFGIELSDTYLLTFIDGKVAYHANTRWSQSGQFIEATKSRYYPTFNHPFNLMLHIGVIFGNARYEPGEDELKTLLLSVFEIDYVRVYGESLEGFRNDTIILNTPNDPPPNDSSIIYALIGVVILVVILIILIIVVIYYFMRKREQNNNQDNYDDIRLSENKYDEYDYNYAYEVVHYTNEENYQAHPNEYLVLTDPLAENLDQNNENMIDINKV